METLQLPTVQGPGGPALVIAPHTAMLGITDAKTVGETRVFLRMTANFLECCKVRTHSDKYPVVYPPSNLLL
jgi:hypothetical protein